MAGTHQGGLLAKQRNIEKYGEDFYSKIGSQGGKKGKVDGAIKGFAQNHNRAVSVGRIGGLKSRRGKIAPKPEFDISTPVKKKWYRFW